MVENPHAITPEPLVGTGHLTDVNFPLSMMGGCKTCLLYGKSDAIAYIAGSQNFWGISPTTGFVSMVNLVKLPLA